ncbi:multiprotein-bridging factor 1 family protein [Acidobacteriota bacterium]
MAQINNRFIASRDLQGWMTLYPDYKDQIRILRQSLGMTQAQLAKLVDRTPRSVRMIENGEAYPRVTTLQNIAAALNADLIISLVPKTGVSEFLNESSTQVEDKSVRLNDIDMDSTSEMPSTSISGSDIQIGETD